MLDGDGGACGDRGAATATALGGDTPDDGVARPCLGVLGVLGANVIRRRRVRGFGGPPCSSVAAADAAAAAIVAASKPLPPLVVPTAPPASLLPRMGARWEGDTLPGVQDARDKPPVESGGGRRGRMTDMERRCRRAFFFALASSFRFAFASSAALSRMAAVHDCLAYRHIQRVSTDT